MIHTINGSGKFQWGLNIDGVWKYAGLAAPKSIVIPHILSLGHATDRLVSLKNMGTK